MLTRRVLIAHACARERWTLAFAEPCCPGDHPLLAEYHAMRVLPILVTRFCARPPPDPGRGGLNGLPLNGEPRDAALPGFPLGARLVTDGGP